MDFFADHPSAMDPAALFEELTKNQARIRQLRAEIQSRKGENAAIVAENLRQNETLRQLNETLDSKVQARTRELEASKRTLEDQNQKLQEIGASKEALTHMIVHDMKNPLTAIMGTLSLMRGSRFNLEADAKSLVVDAHVQSVKLLCMVEEILTISRMQSKEFEIQTSPSDLVTLIQQSLSMMSLTMGHKKLRLRFEPSTSELVALMDYQMVERIINNLVNNAIKYAPAESDIVLDIAPHNDVAEVGVTNFGTVIPAEYQQKIFDMFCRVEGSDCSKVSGTGLGLAFCKLAVNAHGGQIGVTSPVPPGEQGARFWFRLPLAPAGLVSTLQTNGAA